MTAANGKRDTELIILGGGCAGLSLAARLVEQKPEMAITIVEPRTKYEEDRTWCGWRVEPHFFSDCVVAQWNEWSIVTPGQRLRLHSAAYPYEMIRASLVYDKARRLIEGAGSAEILPGASAVDVTESNESVEVRLADGRVLHGPWVIDTRPRARRLTTPWLWQNFVGYVVRPGTPSEPDAGVPILMEFQPPGESVAQFMYTIPCEDGRVLVECTRFSKVPGEERALETELLAWLHARYGHAWTLERRESGSLPMAPPLASTGRRVVQAGTRGGSMRVSTGYAFHRIQRWADDCARSILLHGRPLAPSGNALLGVMDELFLRVLQQPSTSAADLFGDLFRSCPTDRLIRFLSGVPRASDLWPVASGLPWGRFLRQAPQLAGSWFRNVERLGG